METADDFEEVFPGVFRWEIFSPTHKVELTSHAVVSENRLYCFDPIPLVRPGMDQLTARGTPHAIVLTNGNHERASEEWRRVWQVPIWVPADSGLTSPDYKLLPAGRAIWEDDWELYSLAGGAPGETAFISAGLSMLIVGDAIVNLPYRGLELLPAKYCVNRSLLELNLRKVIPRAFERLCVAHGQPLAREASKAVSKLLS